jgi:hypothetical protein
MTVTFRNFIRTPRSMRLSVLVAIYEGSKGDDRSQTISGVSIAHSNQVITGGGLTFSGRMLSGGCVDPSRKPLVV